MSKEFDENDSDIEEDEDLEEEMETRPRIIIKEQNAKLGKLDNIVEDEEEDDEEDDGDGKSEEEEDDDDSIVDEDEDVLEEEPASNRSTLPKFPEFDDDVSGADDDDDDMSEDDNYLQKFDESTNHNIISEFHPEMQVHNYDEIDIMTTIVRDSNGIIVDPLHRTLPFITKYEKARVLGERAKQLNSGATATVDVDPTVIDGYLIALKEYEAKRIPFIIKRPLPNGGCEYWRFSDLEI